ncbi:MAG: hypothetical protein AM324_001390 [Candidatus Thorarchaeota archaeon SMTZ1-83]|nr:MAG: hypothetical protein AM324_02290 [Candidatus Thorarchaeota archaeon SMTZ1-83]
MSDCPICGRPSGHNGELCQYHQLAIDNLHEGEETWRSALGIDWDSYLDHLYALDELGLWVREVIEYIRSGNSP